MKERGILMQGKMVRAIMGDRKTLTSRWLDLAEGQSSKTSGAKLDPPYGWGQAVWPMICPYGQPGDRLW